MLTLIACLTNKKLVRNHATLKLSLSAIRFILVWRQLQRDYTLSFEQFPGAFLFFVRINIFPLVMFLRFSRSPIEVKWRLKAVTLSNSKALAQLRHKR